MDKFKQKLPREDLKRYAKEVGQVASPKAKVIYL